MTMSCMCKLRYSCRSSVLRLLPYCNARLDHPLRLDVGLDVGLDVR